MKRLLILAAALLAALAPSTFAAAAAAADTGSAHMEDDSIGFFFDPEAIFSYMWTSAYFEQVRGYLMIANPTLGGVSRWQCRVEMTGHEPVSPQWTLAGDVAFFWDPTEGGNFDIEIGLGDYALRPAGNLILLATWDAFILDPAFSNSTFIDILPLPGSVLFTDAPGYVDGDDPGLTAECTVRTSIFAEGHCAAINPTDVMDSDGSSWGGVKAMFR